METLLSPQTRNRPSSSPPCEDGSIPDEASVNRVLGRVLSSPPFCHTLQCQNLLRYIVKHSLAHEEHLLRERVIGAEIFGRRPDYEPGEDPVVRIRVADVRKRLAQFYQLNSGSSPAPEVQIDIPSGSYCASFRWRESSSVLHELLQPDLDEAAPSALDADLPSILPALELAQPTVQVHQPIGAVPSRRVRRTGLWLLAVCVLAVLAFSAYDLIGSAQDRAYRDFWQPLVASSKPVIISVGSNAVYRISDQLADHYAAENHLQSQGEEFYVPISPDQTITGKDIHSAPNSFVALGDVSAISGIVAALTRQNRTFQERFPDDISFAELRNSPTVLVGGFNNPMTIELTKYLPFVLKARNEIDDTRSPGRRWVLHGYPDWHEAEDYAIVTRLPQKNNDSPILAIAGMGSNGTAAASVFVCSPAAIAQLVRTLPKGWEHRNLQLVLHVRVVDFKAVSSDVVAVRSW